MILAVVPLVSGPPAYRAASYSRRYGKGRLQVGILLHPLPLNLVASGAGSPDTVPGGKATALACDAP